MAAIVLKKPENKPLKASHLVRTNHEVGMSVVYGAKQLVGAASRLAESCQLEAIEQF